MKKSIGKKTIVFPHPVFIIGTYDSIGKPNMMAVSWGGICCSDPPCVAISVRKQRFTYNNLMDNMAFTVNIPSTDYINEADFVGIVSGKDKDKFRETHLTPIDSGIVKAPYIDEFPMALICKVINILEIGVHTQFIGEILDIIADEEILNDKNLPDIKKVKPFSYNSADRSYYATGDRLISGYSVRNIVK